jgi:predicted exporter
MSRSARAWLFAAMAAAVAGACAWHLVRGIPLQTNPLAMLPATERDPLAEQVAGRLGSALAGRVMFLVAHDDEAAARRGAEAFARALAGGGVRAVARLSGLDPAVLAELYAPRRFGLLSERDRAALAEGSFDLRQAALREALAPMPQPKLLPLALDPFGLLRRWAETLDARGGRLALRDGFLQARERGRTHVLVLGEIEGDAYDEGVQRRALEACEAAATALRAADARAEVLRSGIVFHAAAARASAKRDMERIAAGSVAGIAALMLLAFRSLRPLLLGLLSAAIGMACALLALLASDGELHLISVAFGASLIGEAVDYSILFFAAHLAAGQAWTPERGLAEVRPGLRVAVATSLLAYALLALLPFPGVSQVARFALVGLAVAYLCVVWLLPALVVAPTRRDPASATRWAARLLDGWSAWLARPAARWGAALCLLACVPGWLALQPNDDVRLLVAREPQLMAQEDAVRALTGFGAGGRFFLVRGADEEEVLEREARLTRRLRELERAGQLTGFQAVSNAVPPRAVQQANRDLLALRVFNDAEGLRRALAQVGFPATVAGDLLDEFKRSARPLTVEEWLASPLSLPLRGLWRPAPGGPPASVVVPRGERDAALLAQAGAGLDGVMLVDKAASVSLLLGRYRAWAVPGLLAGAAAILLVLVLRYGVRDALRLMLPVALAEAGSAALFGYFGEPVTIFAVGGWMLTLGIGVNYAIFLREGMHRPGATAMAVLLAGATTVLAWGLLALSAVPALRQFGLALLTGIALAVVLSPLGARAPEPAA